MMRDFRTLLILLLCLTVPAAAWASVAGGTVCAHSAHKHGTHDEAEPHQHADEHQASAVKTSDQHPITGILGSDCDTDDCRQQCACGCGMGACMASFAAFLPSPASLLFFGRSVAIVSQAHSCAVPAPGGSPLRPPIS